MRSIIMGKRKIDHINVSTLADDIIFTLGDYLKYRKLRGEDVIDLGVEFCEAILHGGKIDSEKVKMEDVLDYERFKIIERNSRELEIRGFNMEELINNTGEVISYLVKIKQGEDVSDVVVKKIQKYFIAISTPFWKENIKSFRSRKINRGLRINE
jgi:hypothetical protein